VDLIGGDTTTSQRGFVISITAIGEVAPDSYVKRSGAKVNDLICVSGDLGGAFLGLTILEREKKIFENGCPARSWKDKHISLAGF
jgi:thiamine-monophosphate kinase